MTTVEMKTLKALTIYAITIICFLGILACADSPKERLTDSYNDIAYQYHYKNLDSTSVYAQKALALSPTYKSGYCEALNNLAFVDIVKMRYKTAERKLDEIQKSTDNQVELLVSFVQSMRICQRLSLNKKFYIYQQKALGCMKRIGEDSCVLSDRQRRRFSYAETEYKIVLSTYLYYVGQTKNSAAALLSIDPYGEILKDTAQLLAYYYNMGTGALLASQSHSQLIQSEFDYLLRCHTLARQNHYVYWEANALQAISEHILPAKDFRLLREWNPREFEELNTDRMPDSLLAGNLAQHSLLLFEQYGDNYQIAGAWRTLSYAYFEIKDFPSALACLDKALKNDTTINQTPDMVASIREQMSIVYSAMDNKAQSDYNRNLYLDIQEQTRQDRLLEARAEQLEDSLGELNVMMRVIMAIILVSVMYGIFVYFKRKRSESGSSVTALGEPLRKWKEENFFVNEIREDIEDLQEQVNLTDSDLKHLYSYYVEQRAKISFASSLSPLISRMIHEVDRLCRMNGEDAGNEGYEYVKQVIDNIIMSNQQLTNWIKIRQGEINIRIESFPIGEIFDMVSANNAEYEYKGIRLNVVKSDSIVKADKTLTLFMVNTISENARRYTPSGGNIDIYSSEGEDYVEISIRDTGCGMSADDLKGLFSHAIKEKKDQKRDDGHGYGYGLVNCKGIINKYQKLSSIFKVCRIGAESELGKGSRIYFRLPKGIKRIISLLLLLVCANSMVARQDSLTLKAGVYADSAYYCNIRGDYQRTLLYADSCISVLNSYVGRERKGTPMRLKGTENGEIAELAWFNGNVRVDYNIILDIRNEVSIAALALHEWDLYSYNNEIYTKLFRECSADESLPSFVAKMQKANINMNVAIILLILILLTISVAYYLFVYRYHVSGQMYLDRMNEINRILADRNILDSEKIRRIDKIWHPAGQETVNKGYANPPLPLANLYNDIHDALVANNENIEQFASSRVALEENYKKKKLERDRLYVVNNILDNDLSSLKHETMFYPARLKQILDTSCCVRQLKDVAGYYGSIYNAFIEKVTYTAANSFFIDVNVYWNHLLEILKNKNMGIVPDCKTAVYRDNYIKVEFRMSELHIDTAHINGLFTQHTSDVDFLVCSQIIRDLGSCYHARGCGIKANKTNNNIVIIEVIITKEIWKSLKS